MENLSSDGNNLEWQKIFQEALVEVNPEKLKEKIAESEAAIFQRLQALQPGPDHVEELRGQDDAGQTHQRIHLGGIGKARRDPARERPRKDHQQRDAGRADQHDEIRDHAERGPGALIVAFFEMGERS